MTIYDAFTFFNEYDLLRVRLIEHASFVDKFIISRGTHTFSGKPNPYRLDLGDPRIVEFADRIVIRDVALTPAPCNAWENEFTQRNALFDGLHFSDEDVVLLSDLDEIVSRDVWPQLLSCIHKCGALALKMHVYYYFVNLRASREIQTARIATGRFLRNCGVTPQELRKRAIAATDYNCGWHFSYIGDEAFIRNTIQSFAHQEFNRAEIIDERRIRRVLERQRDLFGRRIRYHWVRFDESWPLEMVRNAEWRKFICPRRPVPLQLCDDVVEVTFSLMRRGRTKLLRLLRWVIE